MKVTGAKEVLKVPENKRRMRFGLDEDGRAHNIIDLLEMLSR